ncbi:transcriptional regulator [Streptomyces solincola]|uniref:Transcriptional regulator n=1 Tax=Streptomyces solincola TaxID=2100817 RepID=A0A2S9PTT5_9ACTN|nr:helix-turn-helix transcriptional regulator [Streptomyces solincola]PRH77815.1 transcriptional regulator [Streptomyces solincola]
MHPSRKPGRPSKAQQKSDKVTSWHLIGAQLAQLRRADGLSQPQLADRIAVSVETLASIEQGRRPLRLDRAQQLDDILGTGGVLAAGVARVPDKERYPLFAQDFIELEAAALALSSYESQTIPGILQTEGYAAAVFASRFPPYTVEEQQERRADRIDRQKLFDREPSPPVMSFIIEQSVLECGLGGPEVTCEQIRHLHRIADLPYVSLQIMPRKRTTHAGLNGPFVLLETEEHQSLAYIEGQRVSFLIQDPSEVSILQQKYGMLRSQALNTEDSKDLLDDLAGEA